MSTEPSNHYSRILSLSKIQYMHAHNYYKIIFCQSVTIYRYRYWISDVSDFVLITPRKLPSLF
jgi:hypothetical protein